MDMRRATLIMQRLLQAFLFCTLGLSACSIDISQTATAVPTAPVQAATSLFPTLAPPGAPQVAATNLPVTWADLHLTGKLLYTAAVLTNNDGWIDVNSLDLTTGHVTPIFQTASHGWVDSAAISPDSKQLVISYAPPANIPNGGQETLYILPADGSKLAEYLFTPADLQRSECAGGLVPGWQVPIFCALELWEPRTADDLASGLSRREA